MVLPDKEDRSAVITFYMYDDDDGSCIYEPFFVVVGSPVTSIPCGGSYMEHSVRVVLCTLSCYHYISVLVTHSCSFIDDSALHS